MKICTCSLLGTVPALALATTLAAQSAMTTGTDKADGTILHRAVTPGNIGEITRTKGKAESFGFLAGGNPCAYSNGDPVDCFGAPAAQEDPSLGAGNGSFFAEAADDFELVDLASPDNPCQLTDVTFWVTFFGGDGLDHPDDISGVHVTVYPDAGGVPAGTPNGDGTGTHTGAIATEFTQNFTVTLVPGTVIGDFYRIDVTGLDLLVPKNEKLWLAPAIQLDFDTLAQSANMLSNTNTGDPAVQIFPEAGIEDWTVTGGNAGCDPPDPDGTLTDMAFVLNGVKDPGQPGGGGECPGDCAPPPDGTVSTVDLLYMLGGWGGTNECNIAGGPTIDTVDLLFLLGMWGDCPAGFDPPANDECPGPAVPTPGMTDIDLKGATPSDPPPVNTTPGGDIWYTTSSAGAGNISVRTNADVFCEVYEGVTCVGAVVGFGRSMSGNGTGGVTFTAAPGTTYNIRLINDLGIGQSGDDDALKGAMVLDFQPALENCDDALAIDADGTVYAGDICNSAGQASNAGDCPTFSQAEPGQWYEVTDAAGGLMTASVDIPLAGLWDGVLQVFCGQCGVVLNCVDECQITAGVGCSSINPPNITGTVTWCAEAGETYYILISDGGNSATTCPAPRAYALSVTNAGDCGGMEPPFCGPENDACEDALVATDTSQPQGPDQPDAAGVTPFDTSLATTDGQENPAGMCNDFGENQTWNDLWWTYTATSTGVLTFTTCPELIGNATGFTPPDPYDTDIVLYGPYGDTSEALAACPPPAEDIVACNDDDPVNACGTAAPFASTVEALVLDGDVYICRVGGWGAGDFGEGNFMLDLVEGIPTGACCVGGTCTDDVEVTACEPCGIATFFEGQACADVTCSDCDYLLPVDTPDDAWTFAAADVDPDLNLRQYQLFPWAGGDITSVDWVALDIFFDGAFAECDQDPVEMSFELFADAAGEPGAAVPGCSIVASVSPVVNGDNYGGFSAKNFRIDSIAGCSPVAGTYWISLTGGIGEDDDCWHYWGSSPGCGDTSVAEDLDASPGTYTANAFALNFCLNGSFSLAIGACCNDGICTGDGLTLGECQATFGEFVEGETCATLTCPDAKCAGADYQQRAIVPGEGGTFLTSDEEPEIRRYDNFVFSGGSLDELSTNALTLNFTDGVGFDADCTDSGLTLQVNIYPDFQGEPRISSPVCELNSLTPSTAVGDTFGFAFGDSTAFKYTVDISACGTVGAGTYWVSIMADATVPDGCFMLILSSPEGDGQSRIEDFSAGGTGITNDASDLNFCINP